MKFTSSPLSALRLFALVALALLPGVAEANAATGNPANGTCAEEARVYIQGVDSPYRCDPSVGAVESPDGLQLARCTYTGTMLLVSYNALSGGLDVFESNVAENCPGTAVQSLPVGLPDPRVQSVDNSPSYMQSIERCTNTGTMIVIFGDRRLEQVGSFEYATEACQNPLATPRGA